MSEETKFDSWALVELFGHHRIVGKVTEATLAGGAFLRVDVPAIAEDKAFTRFYGPGAIYAISPLTEEIAMGLVKACRHEPVNRFAFAQLAEKVNEPDEEEYDGPPGDDE